MLGGHEGAGVIKEVGPGYVTWLPGDPVSASFIPSCGRCRFCVTGRQYLCQQGSQLMLPGQMTDGVVRHFCRGEPLNLFSKCGTFSRHSLLCEQSVIKVDPDLNPTVVALVSCGVATGWGSAVHRAGTVPGDTVVVVGCGGVGMNAVQGAADGRGEGRGGRRSGSDEAGSGTRIRCHPYQRQHRRGDRVGARAHLGPDGGAGDHGPRGHVRGS